MIKKGVCTYLKCEYLYKVLMSGELNKWCKHCKYFMTTSTSEDEEIGIVEAFEKHFGLIEITPFSGRIYLNKYKSRKKEAIQ